MNPIAQTEYPIHALLTRRWSPYAFDPNRDVSEQDLNSLFEAARWAMSSYNAQPWRYIVGVKSQNQELWQKIHDVLLEGNKPWTKNAPVLALGIIENNFEHNGKPNKAAQHDLGAASAFLTLEATARGLHVHQMIGIDPDKAREVFDITGSLEPLTGLAIGYLGSADDIPEDYAKRDRKERQRKSIEDIILQR